MKTGIYTIYDRKAGIYQFPYQFHNDAVALRACQDLVNQGDSQIAKHPADYIMFKLGEYDDNEGVFVQLSTKEIIAEFHHLQPSNPWPMGDPQEDGHRYDQGMNSTPESAVPASKLNGESDHA